MNESNDIKTAILNKNYELEAIDDSRGCECFTLFCIETEQPFWLVFETKQEHEDGETKIIYTELGKIDGLELTAEELKEIFDLLDMEPTEWV
tara:strand:- start:9982 stop:10257 length:276 start_codon:yes stop_codon:yes gene_type:complete